MSVHDLMEAECDISAAGHKVFVSEYAMPADFKVCLEIVTNLDMRDATDVKPERIEKLCTL